MTKKLFRKVADSWIGKTIKRGVVACAPKAWIYTNPNLWSSTTQDVLEKVKGMTLLDRYALRELTANTIQRFVDLGETSIGLIYAAVQSGKTHCQTVMTSLWRDAGNLLTIVITEDKVDQHTQTCTDRFVPMLNENEFVVVNCREVKPKDIVHIIDAEIKKRELGEPHKNVVLITTKNNRSRLTSLINLLRQRPDFCNEKTLILHDEADRASMDVGKDGVASPIHQSICELRKLFPVHYMLHFTATPEALLMITTDDCLAPEFASYLKPGEGYVGLAELIDSKGVFNTIKQHDKHDVTFSADGENCLLEFFVGEAVRRLKGMMYSEGGGTPSDIGSMLIVPSHLIAEQSKIEGFVHKTRNRFYDTLKQGNVKQGNNSYTELVDRIRQFYGNFSFAFTSGTEFEDVLVKIQSVMIDVNVRVINQKESNMPTETEWRSKSSWIFIGGHSLSRGVTIKGLWCSFMSRGSGNKTSDTVYQLARFLGYRNCYREFIRVSVSKELFKSFKSVVRVHQTLVKAVVQHGHDIQLWDRLFIIPEGIDELTRKSIQNLREVNIFRFFKKWVHQEKPWEISDDPVNRRNAIRAAVKLVKKAREIRPGFLKYLEEPDFMNAEEENSSRFAMARHKAYETSLQSVVDVLEDHFQWRIDDRLTFLTDILKRRPDEMVTVVDMSQGVMKGFNSGKSGTSPHIRTRSRKLRGSDTILDKITPTRMHQGRSTYGGLYKGDSQIFDPTRITLQIHSVEFHEGKQKHNDGSIDKAIPHFVFHIAEDYKAKVISENPVE